MTRLTAALLLASALLPGQSSTVYFGGSKKLSPTRVATDRAGNRFVTGSVVWNDIGPYPGTVRTDLDVFLTAVSPDGAIRFTLYFGGDGLDEARAIALDPAGNIYIAGVTGSLNFPSLNAFQPASKGGQDAFVCRLTPTGGFTYCTYIGGQRSDQAWGVATDASGAAYVTGETMSTDFPVTPGAFQTTTQPPDNFRMPSDAFVTKVSPDGRSLLYSTYLGGKNVVCIGGSRCIPAASHESGKAIAVDAAGNAYIAGRTNSSDFPVTPGAFQPQCQCDYSSSDAFITKLNPTGSALTFSTHLGGRAPTFMMPEEDVSGLALDAQGNVVIGGVGWSLTDGAGPPPFPTTPGAFQPRLDFTGRVPFVTSLAGTGASLVWSTFLSGKGEGVVNGVALDGAGSALVTGTTSATDFPVAGTGYGKGSNFYAQLSSNGSRLLYSTLFPRGAAGVDVTHDPQGQVHLTGSEAYLVTMAATMPQLPPILGVVHAAGTVVTGKVTVGELISIFGPDIGPATPLGLTIGPDGKVTTELGGVRVLVSGKPAPLTYAQRDQINAVIPWIPGQPLAGSRLEVVRNGQTLGALQLSLTAVDPQVFRNGDYAAALNEDGSVNSQDNPAGQGSVVAIYATGLGLVSPLPADGEIPTSNLPRVVQTVEVLDVANRELEVLYAGQAPGLVAGVMQINFRLATSGLVLPYDPYLRLNVGGIESAFRVAVAGQ